MRNTGSAVWTPDGLYRLGSATVVAVEPRIGFRALTADGTTVTELVGDLRASVSAASQRTRWWLSAEQRVRAVTDSVPAPVYLDPDRRETWGRGGVAIPIAGQWLLEATIGAGVVRYGPATWQQLDRTEVLGTAKLSHALGPGLLRLTVGAGNADFTGDPFSTRDDGRWALNAEWALRGSPFVQLELGAAWNSSSIETFDYRALRAAVLLSASLGRSSLQLYSALAAKSYRESSDTLLLVDQETGSFVIAQATSPIAAGTFLHLRAEWVRSESTVRSRLYQRLGASALVGYRWPVRRSAR
ncbi:MAG: hypothetical protein ACREMV_04110 [Gemmatimonadales bacterium]